MHTKTYPNLSCMVWQRCTYEPNYQTSTMLTCVKSLQQSISMHHGLRKWRSSWASEFLGVMTKGEVVKKNKETILSTMHIHTTRVQFMSKLIQIYLLLSHSKYVPECQYLQASVLEKTERENDESAAKIIILTIPQNCIWTIMWK